MAKATWNGAVLAESDDIIVVEGNHYFPAESLNQEHFRGSDHTSFCGWKGTANYRSVVVGNDVNENAAWVYEDPKPEAEKIRGRFAFWKGVLIED